MAVRNWGPRVDLPSKGQSCSSEVHGAKELGGQPAPHLQRGENAVAAHKLSAEQSLPPSRRHAVHHHPQRGFRQLLASGNIAGDQDGRATGSSNGANPADAGDGGQADDVNFAAQPEGSCSQHTANCTDPNENTTFAADMLGGVLGPAPDTYQYPARRGLDEFYGYGRLNAYKGVEAAANGDIRPEAEITSPELVRTVNPALSSFNLNGYGERARPPTMCRVDIAPGWNRTTRWPPPIRPATPHDPLVLLRRQGRSLGVATPACWRRSTSPTSNRCSRRGDPASFRPENEDGGHPQTGTAGPTPSPTGSRAGGREHAKGLRMTGEDRRQLSCTVTRTCCPAGPRSFGPTVTRRRSWRHRRR